LQSINLVDKLHEGRLSAAIQLMCLFVIVFGL
jgi:hypothetical protein